MGYKHYRQQSMGNLYFGRFLFPLFKWTPQTEEANQEGTIQRNIEQTRHKTKTNKTTRCSLGAAAYCLFTCKERDIRHIRDTNLRPVLDSTPHNQQ
jgi:hypothetical protein